MPQNVRLRLTPAVAADEVQVLEAALKVSGYRPDEVLGHRIRKRSIDARKGIFFQLDVDLYLLHEELPNEGLTWTAASVHQAPRVAVIGMGPAGLFAALRLVELGLKPVLFERGKDVRARRRDLAKITRDHEVNPNSNYCFGEGGAGTYSDGKLYTRSVKRGNVSQVLDLFVAFGADQAIRVDAHPHIGTNKLPDIIAAMREALLDVGAEVHFETQVVDFIITKGRVSEVITKQGALAVEAVVLATGHSARDVFELFADRGWAITSKPFALGVRVEHPQSLIDQIQYHCDDRGPYLPPASYSLVHQVNDRGVYSFCMCPGGIIAPCATAPGEVVTNGWSPSRRNNPFANSGMVVSVEQSDLERMGYTGPLAAMHFQRDVEQRCCQAAGGTQAAPAQRLVDFVNRKRSKDLPDCSYKPGLVSVNLHEVLPSFIADRLAQGFEAFGRKMRGFLTNNAVVVAPESRTSSPVRIPRDEDTLQHPDLPMLYPCGEGAGYAGGIVSAALDGLRVAEAVALAIRQASPAADQPSSI